MAAKWFNSLDTNSKDCALKVDRLYCLTLRAQKWAVVSRLDFLFSFLNSHRGEKLWQLHLIPRPHLTKYQILTKLYLIHVDWSVNSALCFSKQLTFSLRPTHVFKKNGKWFFKNFLTLWFWLKNRSNLWKKLRHKHCRRDLKWQIFTQSVW